MKALASILLGGIVATACVEREPSEPTPVESVQMTTIETAPPRLKPIEEPPRIEFDHRTTEGADSSRDSGPPPPAGLVDLPFSPRIAMDPVDGSKLTIRRNTPIAEFDGRIFYFSSEANRLQFVKNPERYLSGAFASY